MTTTTRDTRQTIVSAAAELFRRQGFAGTTMQHVAEATGISKGNLTYHFPSKQALYEAVHEAAMSYMRERILARSFAEAADAREAIAAVTRRLRRWFLDQDGHFVGCLFTNVAVETRHADPVVARLASGALREIKAELARHLAEAQQRGLLPADRSAAELAQAWFWAYEGSIALSRALDDPAEYDAFCRATEAWLAP